MHVAQGSEASPAGADGEMDPGDQGVRQESDPELDEHGVARAAPERLDREMLLDPLEEEFDLPPLAIELSDGPGREFSTVRQEDEALVRF